MIEAKSRRYERQRNLIVILHDAEGYSFREISKMPQFRVSAYAIYKRYRKQKNRIEPKLGGLQRV